jgi:hypothetical protein
MLVNSKGMRVTLGVQKAAEVCLFYIIIYLVGFLAPFFTEGTVSNTRAETDDIDTLGLDLASQRICN